MPSEMTFTRFRLLRRWLLGIYLIAQAAGVFPLMYGHTLVVYETMPAVSNGHLANDAGRPETNHRHGLIDYHDQCCTLHSLTGPLPPIASPALIEREATQLFSVTSVTLVSWHPSRLDRPPKSHV